MEKSGFPMEVPGEIRLPREACVSSPGIGSHPSEMQECPHKLCKARRVCIPRSLRGRAKGNLHGTKPKRGFLPHPFPRRCSLRNPSLLATASPPFSPLPPLLLFSFIRLFINSAFIQALGQFQAQNKFNTAPCSEILKNNFHGFLASTGVKCGKFMSLTNLYLNFFICTTGTIASTAKNCEN